MTTLAFDSLRYARRLRDAGVPEPQADVQAELMAEAFGFYAENILTRDHFTEVLNARFGEFGAQMDARFAEQDAKFGKTLSLHTWMLGILVVAIVVPQLQAWLG
ncbi:hypothetical protein Q6D67_20935 [Haliea sp. E1-2-M8]|uniref:hypothetical protein n=1 Tax=Haliea sp. E1-2-M8 TaxID=3064706 RepID=UPI0027266BA0|nr:hypothetical protein [Haliea sp. E1-2-M8]MDO8864155.1 hypothetical protein [Haliea sp. E1-2-M8]